MAMASEAIAKVKDIQKGSQEGRKQWGLWCDTRGNGVRDPSKHTPEFLEEFVAQYNAGGRLESPAPEKVETLAELVKTGQRNSHHWQQAWTLYCQRFGHGVNDPYKHNSAFLVGFMDFLAYRGCMAMYGSVLDAGYNYWDWNESYDPRKDSLVQKIKAMQRSNEEAKRQWWQFCDNRQGGIRDPTRHDVRVLQEFLNEQGSS
eukprot:s2250_g9.t1